MLGLGFRVRVRVGASGLELAGGLGLELQAEHERVHVARRHQPHVVVRLLVEHAAVPA